MTRVKQVTAAVTNVPRKRNLQRADGTRDSLPGHHHGSTMIR